MRPLLPLLLANSGCEAAKVGLGADAADSASPGDTGGDDTAQPRASCEGSSEGGEILVADGGATPVVAGSDADCWNTRVVGVGAVNMTINTHFAGVTGEFEVAVTDPAGHELAPTRRVAADASVSFQLWQSGEFFLDFRPIERDGELLVSVACVDRCDQEYTRYPIVLMHGLGGAGTFAGVDYFYEVRDDLEARGYLVRNPSVEPYAGSDQRAEEWAVVLSALEAEGLGRKFNLVGHSQGGLDARYLVSALGWGDRIASIDMIGTPNHGTEVADALYGVIEDGIVDAGLIDLGTTAFAELYGLSADDPSLTESMAYITTENIAAFNTVILDDPRVYYSSWAGVTCGSLEPSCQEEHGGEVVEALLEPLYLILWFQDLEGDAMVPAYSVEWGDYQGQINADHADEIGQIADEDNPPFDHRAFYLAEARRLGGLGY